MRCLLTTAVAAILLAAAPTALFAQKQAAPARPAAKAESRTAAEAPRHPEEKNIRALADVYVKTYNNHDAAAVANLFTADAQIVDEEGGAVQGRKEIEQVFKSIFDEFPQAKCSVTILSIRFLNPSLAVEDGTANVVLAPGEPAEPNRYTVVHVKQDGKWQMASAHDLPSESAPASDQLKQLDWLIGEWVDESPDSLIVTSYRWDDNKNFILSDFTIQVAGRSVMNGSQRIGWDPLAKVIRSWVFDSEGGFAEGTYSRNGDQWTIKMNGVTRDGKIASATNSITRIGKGHFAWGSRDRAIGGERTPDVEEVTVARKPPKPM